MPTWNVREALRTMATNARTTARMFEKRAGRIPGAKPLQVPSERAAAERKALAFLRRGEADREIGGGGQRWLMHGF
jgi:hypothetical protein